MGLSAGVAGGSEGGLTRCQRSILAGVSRVSSKMCPSPSAAPLMEAVEEMSGGLVQRDSVLNMELKGKGARAACAPNGTSPAVLQPGPVISADSCGMMESLSVSGVASSEAPVADGRGAMMGSQFSVGPTLQHASVVDGSSIPTLDAPCVPVCLLSAAVPYANVVDDLSPSLCGGGLVLGHGGPVSEEVRVTPAAREALRSQPTDGLRQPPSSPVLPVSGAEGGVGMDGKSGCRSCVDRSTHFCLIVMVGRRELSQRRVVENSHDSRSPGPRHPVMFRGSPSPPTTFHRRPAPSPGTRPRRLRSPSPLLRSSVDPNEVCSSEVGDEDTTKKIATESEEEDDGQRGEEDGLLISSTVPDLSPLLEDDSLRGGSSSSIS
ncbi:hypothetical protein Dimus_037156 [Dionaea muscipula]